MKDKNSHLPVSAGKLTYFFRKLFRLKTVTFSDGLRVCVGSQLPRGIRRAIYKETYELKERKLVHAVLQENDRVLEVGSGIGIVASTCARICGPENITCYEANPQTAEYIKRNFALNGMKPQLRMKAMASYSGVIKFFINDNILSSSLNDRDFGGETELPCDDLVEVLKELKPNVLVMDVEGAEVDLLPLVDLSNIEKIIIELHPWVVGEAKIQDLVNSLLESGFRRDDDTASSDDVVCFMRQGL